MTDEERLEGFEGTVKLFPLPNLVLFPTVVQGLHIFEPRYRQMTADALAGDRMLALVLLKEGWEETYDTKPEIETVACLGKITHHEELPDGRYNLRLRGLTRVRLVEELSTPKKYRTARVDVLSEVVPGDVDHLMQLRRRLCEAVLARFDASGQAHGQLRELFQGDMPLGQLCDILAYALPVPLPVKQGLLAEMQVDERAKVMIQTLAEPPKPVNRPFPPSFSAN